MHTFLTLIYIYRYEIILIKKRNWLCNVTTFFHARYSTILDFQDAQPDQNLSQKNQQTIKFIICINPTLDWIPAITFFSHQ